MGQSAMSKHEGEPHRDGIAGRLNWLRAGVLGANDGIVSTAGLVVGVAGATTASGPIVTAGVAGLAAGAVSMALGEYVSVSSQRDTERALLRKERAELAEFPETELDELAAMYVAKGLSPATARQVAQELTVKDALAAHADAELGIDPQALTNPWRGCRRLRLGLHPWLATTTHGDMAPASRYPRPSHLRGRPARASHNRCHKCAFRIRANGPRCWTACARRCARHGRFLRCRPAGWRRRRLAAQTCLLSAYRVRQSRLRPIGAAWRCWRWHEVVTAAVPPVTRSRAHAATDRNLRSRRLLVTTNTDERAIASPAIMGLSRPSAARGTAATL